MREYYYARNSEKLGPFSLEELRSEKLSARSLVWFEGLPSWQFAEDIEEIQSIFQPIDSDESTERHTLLVDQPNQNIDLTKENIVSIQDDTSILPKPQEEVIDFANVNNEAPIEEFNYRNIGPDNYGFFRAPFSFKGRIRRTEWWITLIITQMSSVFIGAFLENESTSPIALISLVPVIWFGVAQAVKRCHDRGNSGWYFIVPFYSLWMAFGDGEAGSNAYGTNPKGREF